MYLKFLCLCFKVVHPIDRIRFGEATSLVDSLTLELLELLHINLLLRLTWPLHRRRSLHWSLLLPLFCCLQHLCYQISLASELLELLHISLLLRMTWSLHRRRSLHWSLLLPLFCCLQHLCYQISLAIIIFWYIFCWCFYYYSSIKEMIMIITL